MIHRDISATTINTAVLAGPPVSGEQVLPVECKCLSRKSLVVRQCDDLWNSDGFSDQFQGRITLFWSQTGPIVPGVLGIVMWVHHASVPNPYLD